MSGKITAQPGSTLAKLLAKKNETKDDVRHPHVSDDKIEVRLSDNMLMVVSSKTPLTTLTGGYYGDDFVSQGEYSVVKGQLSIRGVGIVDANYLFTSTRIDDCYWELLTVTTEKGAFEAVAFYKDAPLEDEDASSTLSSSASADYAVLTSCGELRDSKGHMFRIEFNNVSPNRPRNAYLVPWVGSGNTYAEILP